MVPVKLVLRGTLVSLEATIQAPAVRPNRRLRGSDSATRHQAKVQPPAGALGKPWNGAHQMHKTLHAPVDLHLRDYQFLNLLLARGGMGGAAEICTAIPPSAALTSLCLSGQCWDLAGLNLAGKLDQRCLRWAKAEQAC
jgi:hypothetical protein